MSVDLDVSTRMEEDEASRFRVWFDSIVDNIATVVRGKESVIRLAVQCMLSGGHLLIEDNPGTGKTTLARAMARSVAGSFGRIQFTPDLLPSDVTGVQIYHSDRRQFEFRPGPVFANIVLADEINRASPKTQSAFLEAMAERQITVDGESFPMPTPFLVMATQNPIEMEGTYPLPEAQLDRFMARTSIGYPDRGSEAQIVRDILHGTTTDTLQPVLTAAQLQQMTDALQGVTIKSNLLAYAQEIVVRTRELDDVLLGASPRAFGQLAQLARARAAGAGRPFVTPDDIKALVRPVLAHRLKLRPEAALQGQSTFSVLDRILADVRPPSERSSEDWSR